MIANITTLLDKARAEEVPVVWVQHSDDGLPYGSEAWQYVPELVRREDEPVVHKNFGDAFEATDLEPLLAAARGRPARRHRRADRRLYPRRPCTAPSPAATT